MTAIFTFVQIGCLGGDSSTDPPPTGNAPPDISAISVQPFTIQPNGQASVAVAASDPNSDPIIFEYQATGGSIDGSNSAAVFTADATEGIAWIKVTVTDDEGLNRVGFASINKLLTPPLISIGVLSLDAANSTSQCLAFTLVTTEDIIMLNISVQNPIGQTFNFPGTSFITAGQIFALQPQGSCYNLHSGNYRFTFTLRRNVAEDPFDFVVTHMQPAGAPLFSTP
jgi:hypothetical protein